MFIFWIRFADSFRNNKTLLLEVRVCWKPFRKILVTIFIDTIFNTNNDFSLGMTRNFSPLVGDHCAPIVQLYHFCYLRDLHFGSRDKKFDGNCEKQDYFTSKHWIMDTHLRSFHYISCLELLPNKQLKYLKQFCEFLIDMYFFRIIDTSFILIYFKDIRVGDG